MTVSLLEAVEADPAWMTATWADGAALVKWLQDIGVYEKLAQSNVNSKLFVAWRAGGKAQFWSVDRILVRGVAEGNPGLHPALLPPEIWLPPKNGNGKVAA